MSPKAQAEVDTTAINTLRFLAVDMVEKANSGHPGAPMGQAAMAYSLWTRHLRFSPGTPGWPNRDRFVLSCGHASALIYSLLHLSGFDVPLSALQEFRQFESITPGHPEYGLTPGVETTTGPLGQGLANGVGMAMAEEMLAAYFNRDGYDLLDYNTWIFASDGDLMEGIASEASSLAGHLELGKLIVAWDDNRISIDGSTSLTFSEDVCKRYEAYGWHVQKVEDGNDLEALDAAYEAAREEGSRPSLIAVRTHIGFGSPKSRILRPLTVPRWGAKRSPPPRRRWIGLSSQPFMFPRKASSRFGMPLKGVPRRRWPGGRCSRSTPRTIRSWRVSS